jgi:Na+/H+ antiporter NhaD/arsenite permease-like protein
VKGGEYGKATVGPREALGLLSLLSRLDAGLTAEAETDVATLEIDRERLLDVFEDQYSILLNQIRELGRRTLQLRQRIVSGTYLAPAEGRRTQLDWSRELGLVERLLYIRGGALATLVGDPPNVILGTTLGFNFADFLTHTGPISAVASLLLLGMFYFTNRKALMNAHSLITEDVINKIEALRNEPLHAHLTQVGLIGFLSAVILLVIHHPLGELTGIHINAAMAAMIPAGFALLALQNTDRRKTLLKVDSESILFFAGLFVLIGGLEKIKLFESLADGLAGLTSSQGSLVMALHWVPGLASGIVDNVPLALAMSYVLKDLAQIPGMPALGLMVWSLALGIDIGGNLTPIGASANVVAYSFMERNHGSIGWKRWLVVAVPPTILIMIFASFAVMAKGYFGWH